MMRTSTLIALLVASQAGVEAQHMLDLFADKASMEEHPDSLPGHDSFYAHDLEAFHG